MPEQIKRARQRDSPLASHSDRTTFAIVDFFNPLPPAIMQTCDVVSLKFILHDWSDESAVAILTNVLTSAKSGTKLLISDTVLGTDGLTLERGKRIIDFFMLNMESGARERSFDDVVALLHEAAGRASSSRGGTSLNITLSDPILLRTRSLYDMIETTVQGVVN
mmetsp:Transcript_1439/g.4905  ORF Transcript_1439/g.4905 Transcript_1439/m.4905 type:complete len:164 (-) Transcript_1439:43-534(-)